MDIKMEGMETEVAAQPKLPSGGPHMGPNHGPHMGPPAKKRARRSNNNINNPSQRKQLHSADIVFMKGANLQTLGSLTKQLKDVTEPIIGLQFVWEYRSPSKAVPPHYQCKLCTVSRLQHDMLAHVKGWKHSFRYLKRAHSDKVACEEEEAIKDPALRKTIKETAAEVEKAEGRGQIKVILKEPRDVPAFSGFRTAIPKIVPQGPPGMGLKGQGKYFGGRFSDGLFPGEYPPQGPPFSDFPLGDFQDPGMGGYSNRPGPIMDGYGGYGVGHHHGGDGFGKGGGRDGYGKSGLLGESPGRRNPDDFRGGQMGSGPMDRPGLMGPAPETSSLPATLLSYLDTFRIENENDAQIVLKVTQKLTDVLMDYRLRSVSSGSSMSSIMNKSSLSSMGYSSPPSRLSGPGDRYSGNPSGPSRYSDGPSRYYN